MLWDWPRYSENSWDDFVLVVAGLHLKGRVNLSAIRIAALRERHCAPRERAVRLGPTRRRADATVESWTKLSRAEWRAQRRIKASRFRRSGRQRPRRNCVFATGSSASLSGKPRPEHSPPRSAQQAKHC
jgi:hypothetical protein